MGNAPSTVHNKMPVNNCSAHSSAVWTRPGGVSAGMTHCIATFQQCMLNGSDPYSLIDPVLEGIKRVRAGDALDVVPWRATLNISDVPSGFRHSSYDFNGAEWLLPPDYQPRDGEARVVFVHGGNAGDSALGSYYAGFTSRLARFTRLPVFAFDYATEPVVPWPNNLRAVLSYLEYVSTHGPLGGPSAAGKLLLVADSEGTLVLMQTVIAMYHTPLASLLGYDAVLPKPSQLIGGIVLSSPVVDVQCRTPSFAYNCYNFSDPRASSPGMPGDPDTGNCTTYLNKTDKLDDCLWSYLQYFFGFGGTLMGAARGGTRRRGAATAEVARRATFFSQPILSPLQYDLSGFPPMLVIAARRDYFYADGPRLAERACTAGVDVEAFNVEGSFHDFIEYSEGCGGGAPAEEAIEAYRRVAAFAKRVL